MALWRPGKEVVLFTNPIGRKLLDGLVAYWPLDEASGTRRDLSGNGLTLTDNNTVTGAAGPSSKLPLASQFTSANSESLSRLDTSLLRTASTGLTLEIWVRADTLPGAGSFVQIIGKSNQSTQREYEIQWNGDNSRFFFIMTEDGSTLKTASFPLGNTTGIWYQLIAGWNPATGRLFARQNGGATTLGSTLTTPYTSTITFSLGANSDLTGGFYNGRQAAARKWDRALTDVECAYLYNNGVGRLFTLGRGFV